MADVKWIKIVTDIFDDEKMYAIETLPDGITMEVVWFKLLCLAGKCNNSGALIINDKLAYTDEMLSKIFRLEIGVVQRALDVFQKLEMIELVDNAYMISNWTKYQNNDRLEEIKEKNRDRQRRFRERQKLAIEDKSNAKTVTNNVTSNVTNNVNCSYSYSNNSNYKNLIYILNNNIYKDTSYFKDNIDLFNSIKEWMNYKDNKKPKSNNHYDTEMGICKLLSKIIKYSKEYGVQEVIDTIDESISNNYQGIVWSKLESGKAKPKKEAFNIEEWN